MTPTRWTNWLAISLWTLAIAAALAYMILMHVNGELAQYFGGTAALVLAVNASLATVGTILAVHRPRNPIGWIFVVSSLSNGLAIHASGYGKYITQTAPGALPPIMPLFWFGAWTYLVFFLLPTTFGVLLFPTGRLPSRRWRPFVWLAAASFTLAIGYEMFSPGPLDPEPNGGFSKFNNPLAIESLAGVFKAYKEVDGLLLLIVFVGTIASIFARARSANAVERQQIKWFAYAAVIPFFGFLFELAYFAYTGKDTNEETLGSFIMVFGIAVLPVAVGIAILKHNLYDIDRLINRTLVYGSLTVLLGLGFIGSILFFQVILSPFTNGNDLEVAGSTLLVFALFRPLRDRLQRFVDRRFYRRKYDAERTLASFGATARDAVDLDQLTGELINTISATMQPERLSVWIESPGKHVREFRP